MGVVIAGQWGTTRLHVFLIKDGVETCARSGPGAARVPGRDFEAAFLDVVADWLDAHRDANVVLAGMVGSTFGWQDAGYVECPARAEDAVRDGIDVSARGRKVRIVRGMACTNIMGEPDVLRGEETELLGWQALTPRARRGLRIVCIPGTHGKWVIFRDGVVESFLTSAAGEIFSALLTQGVLTDHGKDVYVPDVFRNAVRDAAAPDASLPHLLFTPRSRTVRGLMTREHAASRLSGLIIGADVAGALRLMGDTIESSDHVTVIGMPEPGARYVDALDELGVPASLLETRTASAAGLSRAAELIADRAVRA